MKKLLCAAVPSLALASAVFAGELRGIEFADSDWEIVCDNTRTCRAAGYHPLSNDDDDGSDDDGDTDAADKTLPVSVLLTRKAGPGQPVAGELQIGHGAGALTDIHPGNVSLTMLIDAAPVGLVALADEDWTARLTPAQVEALLVALLHHGKIEWTDGKSKWRLSDKGATAVMLKMDEFQGRPGTPGALVAKGDRAERHALPAVPAPVVVAPRVPADGRVQLSRASRKALRDALIASAGDECPALENSLRASDYIHVQRLSGTRLVASATCWMGASGVGEAYWVINASPPFAPRIVTTDGMYSNGTIRTAGRASMAGCADFEEWTWNGKRFVQTRKGTTGMCRGISLGGAWPLPVLVTDVRRR
ncbi:DUF1176 domain-containing protein [Massilia dura]|uniref:DUF1176 domain-containing protein n=1 Tax=Pseudoduganella dura TaxID=321982 RepID=A0A6I3XRI7_9BURK|nr:DUF1176 domain-containing protein [Pseudoduganella dura]MUI15932.1 DUF1176 domain-containing protein [Pseudoduganella dura]GGX94677.1 hypothetical protein GCM10007386_26960 [Pseudoduganella dura]